MASAVSKTSKIVVNRNRKMAFLFLLPNIIGFAVFTLIPVVSSIVLSLMKWNGRSAAKFVGLKNFITIFTSSDFLIALRNTVVYTVGTVPFIIAFALIIAFLLENDFKGAAAVRAMFFFPHISSIVAISVVWQLVYAKSGVLNNFLTHLGLTDPPAWLSDKNWALPAIMLMIIWKGIGYYMIIYLAGLRNIDKALYEAATIDGCNSFRRFWHITIPSLKPITFYISVMCIINSFQVFTPIYIMTKGGPGRATTVMVLQIYQDAFVNYEFGVASAEAMVLFACILIVTLIQFRGQRDD
ncbi:sugar ABC transporter permease [Treponema parvum]|uniref:Sugar ABC transporter permease n=1 Tax=Treponema parvum TaxID=138851 RepID=A0A975F585_9SPIR|nr:sugar ABC transporter permease [Treponema parvum]QTQ14597.1 sugar ABC transporter permease [Treponema parvum]